MASTVVKYQRALEPLLLPVDPNEVKELVESGKTPEEVRGLVNAIFNREE